MADKKINDLPLAPNVQDNMFLETDIGGFTSNKITVAQLSDKLASSGASSAGVISGGVITDNLNGTVDVALGTGLFRVTADDNADIIKLSWAYTPNIVIADQTKSYIYADYNVGSPVVAPSLSEVNNLNKILLGTVYKNGLTLFISHNRQLSQDLTGLMQDRQRNIGLRRYGDEGLVLSETAITRTIALSAGTVYAGSERLEIAAIDTSVSGTFTSCYRDGSGGFILTSSVTQRDNANYDDGTGTLASLGVDKYASNSFYIATNNELVMAYGQKQFTSLADALLYDPLEDIPDIDMLLVGRIVFLAGSTSNEYVQLAFNASLTHQATSTHSELSNLAFDASGHAGFQRETITSAIDPTVNDDSTLSYAIGSSWLNTTTARGFRLLNNAAGAAVWIDITTNSNMYCGHVSGGLITINGSDDTKFDVSAGKGYLVDNSDPDNRVIAVLVWAAKTAVSAVFITDDSGTFIGISNAGNVVQQIEDFKSTQPYTIRNVIRLGRLGHFNRATISQVFNYPYHFLSTDIDYACCTLLKGTISGSGGIISNNDANLKLDFTEWLSRRIGANYLTDANAPNTPIVPTTAAFTFFRAYRSATNSTILSEATTDIDPTMWDDGSGTLQALNINEYTIQEVILFPNNANYTAFIMYGQEAYNTVSEAEDALLNYRAQVYSDILGGSSRALIMVNSQATDLEVEIIAGRCIIKEITSEGGVSGGGINYWEKSASQIQPKDIDTDIYTEGNLIADDTHVVDLNTSIVESFRESSLLSGFSDITESTLSFDLPTMTLTVAAVGTSFDVWEGGKKYVKTSDSIVMGAGEGFHTFYYMNGILTELYPYNEPAFIEVVINHASVCYIYYDSVNIKYVLFEERHGVIMDGEAHAYLHLTRGAQYISGYALSDFVIGDGSLAAHAQFTIESGVLADEDLQTTSNQILSTVGTRVLYRNVTDWEWQYNSGFNVITTGTGRLAWDNNGTLTEASNLYHVLYHVYAWNDCTKEPVVFVGQTQYSTAKLARAGAVTEISNINHSGLPTPEMHPIATVIFQTRSTYANAVKAKIILPDSASPTNYYVDWTKTALNPSVSPANHGNLGGLLADDHANHIFWPGRSGGQSITGGTGAGDSLTFQTTSDVAKGNYVFTELADGLLKSATGAISGGNSVSLTTEVTDVLPLDNGGTGIDSSAVTDGQILIGGTTANDLQLSAVTEGTNIEITNGNNSLQVATTSDVTFDNVTVADYVSHAGDTDTNIRFQTDQMTVAVGGAGAGTYFDQTFLDVIKTSVSAQRSNTAIVGGFVMKHSDELMYTASGTFTYKRSLTSSINSTIEDRYFKFKLIGESAAGVRVDMIDVEVIAPIGTYTTTTDHPIIKVTSAGSGTQIIKKIYGVRNSATAWLLYIEAAVVAGDKLYCRDVIGFDRTIAAAGAGTSSTLSNIVLTIPIIRGQTDTNSAYTTTEKIGVGTTAPQELIHVLNDSGEATVEIESTNSGSDSAVKFTTAAGSYGWYTDGSTNACRLRNYNTSDDIITVGLDGNTDFDGNIGINTSTHPTLDFGSAYRRLKYDTSYGNLSLQSSGDVSMIIDTDNNSSTRAFSVRKNSTSVVGGTEIFRIREDGANYFDGLLTLKGTASPLISGRLTLNHAGNTTGIGAVNRTWTIDSYPANYFRVFNCNSSGTYMTGFQISEAGGIYFPNLSTISGAAYIQYNTSSDQIGYLTSALRYKTNITDMEDTSWLYDLRPVNFENKEELGVKQYGLIAEEVEVVNKSFCCYSFVKEKYIDKNEVEQERKTEEQQIETVSYSTLITPMLNEMKKLRKRIEALELLCFC